jgi:hypothetical protein
LGASHKFPHQPAYTGLASFLERNPEVINRQAEELSLAIAQGTDKKFTDFLKF